MGMPNAGESMQPLKRILWSISDKILNKELRKIGETIKKINVLFKREAENFKIVSMYEDENYQRLGGVQIPKRFV